MLFPAAARFMLSGTVQRQICRKPQRVKRQRMQGVHFVCDILQGNAAYSANGIGKIPVHHLRIYADCLKYLGTLIGLYRGYAHFGRNLDNPMQNCIIVVIYSGVIILIQHSVVNQLLDGFLCQIRVHRTGAIADERRKIMNLPRFG